MKFTEHKLKCIVGSLLHLCSLWATLNVSKTGNFLALRVGQKLLTSISGLRHAACASIVRFPNPLATGSSWPLGNLTSSASIASVVPADLRAREHLVCTSAPLSCLPCFLSTWSCHFKEKPVLVPRVCSCLEEKSN